jgi:hypothetical protein
VLRSRRIAATRKYPAEISFRSSLVEHLKEQPVHFPNGQLRWTARFMTRDALTKVSVASRESPALPVPRR